MRGRCSRAVFATELRRLIHERIREMRPCVEFHVLVVILVTSVATLHPPTCARHRPRLLQVHMSHELLLTVFILCCELPNSCTFLTCVFPSRVYMVSAALIQ